MAKLGQLYLQKDYGTAIRLFHHPGLKKQRRKNYPASRFTTIEKDSSDWEQGYGYQICEAAITPIAQMGIRAIYTGVPGWMPLSPSPKKRPTCRMS
jgi:hypothetical protein